MAEMTSSAALSDTNTRGILWDDPFEEDIDQGPSNIQSLDAMKGDDNGDQPEEDPGEDVKNNTKGTGKAAKSKRKKQQRHKHGVRTTQAPAQDGENDDKDSTDNDSISARAGGADTSHKGKGKNAIVRLDPLGEDENGDADGDGGIGDRYQIAGDTSAEQAVGRKGGRSRPSKAATGTLSTAPRSSHNKRKRGDVSESKPRRSSRAAAIFATAQITEQSVSSFPSS
ncbi:hypothetical protein F5X99DRAFT_358756 [Biscogniauxia marginata]|nr:hypothetical protein F5X99DRAFT_358756 [Biscogniauxia marginata]